MQEKQLKQIREIVNRALDEDLDFGRGHDITSNATVPSQKVISGRFLAKSEGILAGLEVAKIVFGVVGKDIVVTFTKMEGEWCELFSLCY